MFSHKTQCFPCGSTPPKEKYSRMSQEEMSFSVIHSWDKMLRHVFVLDWLFDSCFPSSFFSLLLEKQSNEKDLEMRRARSWLCLGRGPSSFDRPHGAMMGSKRKELQSRRQAIWALDLKKKKKSFLPWVHLSNMFSYCITQRPKGLILHR